MNFRVTKKILFVIFLSVFMSLFTVKSGSSIAVFGEENKGPIGIGKDYFYLGNFGTNTELNGHDKLKGWKSSGKLEAIVGTTVNEIHSNRCIMNYKDGKYVITANIPLTFEYDAEYIEVSGTSLKGYQFTFLKETEEPTKLIAKTNTGKELANYDIAIHPAVVAFEIADMPYWNLKVGDGVMFAEHEVPIERFILEDGTILEAYGKSQLYQNASASGFLTEELSAEENLPYEREELFRPAHYFSQEDIDSCLQAFDENREGYEEAMEAGKIPEVPGLYSDKYYPGLTYQYIQAVKIGTQMITYRFGDIEITKEITIREAKCTDAASCVYGYGSKNEYYLCDFSTATEFRLLNGETEGLPHIYEPVSVVKATTSEEGSTELVCSLCGKEKSEVIYSVKSAVTEKKTYEFNNKAVTPAIEVKDSQGNVLEAEYYSVEYEKNAELGTANATVTLNGKYSGTLTTTFQLVPKKIEIKNLLNSADGITIKWAKYTVADGFYIYRSKNGGKFSKIADIKDSSVAAYTDTKVSAGVKYAYKICAYKKNESKVSKGEFGAAKEGVFVKAPVITSVTSPSSGRMLIKWKRVTDVSGFELKYGYGKTSKISATTDTTGIGAWLPNLAPNKTYTVYARVYVVVDDQVYYSAWTPKKSIKIAK